MNASIRALLRSAPLALAALAVSSAVQAGPGWNFSDTIAPANCAQKTGSGSNASTFGNSYNCTTTTGGSPTVSVSAYSVAGTNGSSFAAAYVGNNEGNGFGVKNTSEGINAGSPEHAMDNRNGVTDALLLTFSAAIDLDSVTIGWNGGYDSDITLLRYTGTSAPVLTGKTTATLISSGWELVGSYANLGVGETRAVNSGNLTSSWWLISAYNNSYGGSGTNLDGGNDVAKLLAVAGTLVSPPPNGKVPEPASMALAGIALLAMVGVGRRRKGNAR